jgi:hypothetical protein
MMDFMKIPTMMIYAHLVKITALPVSLILPIVSYVLLPRQERNKLLTASAKQGGLKRIIQIALLAT